MGNLETKAIRHMYQHQPGKFFQFAFGVLHPHIKYQHNWSIDVLGEALSRCHRRETTRLIINMPPRSLKSICTSVAFPAWVLGVQPESKIMCVAGHRGLATEHHELTRNLMTHPRYKSLFPHIRVQESTGTLKFAQGGFRDALTPSGSITGRGANMIIIDDPQSAHEADDPQKSSKICNWFDQNIQQRLNCKHDGVIIVVMQRLAEDDLTGHLLKQKGWELLNLPAIAMQDEWLPESLGGRLARKKGEALHPARENYDILRETMLRISARPFMSQYQQEPYPKGEGEGRGGAFHLAPEINSTEEECIGSKMFMSNVPEEHFVLERAFGERTNLRIGLPPPMTEEQWREKYSKIKQPSNSSLDE